MSESLPQQEAPDPWRRRTEATLRAAQGAWEQAGCLAFGPEARALQDAEAEAREAETRLAGFAPTPGETQAPFCRPLTCGHGGADRRCLACGWTLCADCQPAGGGVPCGRCGGPVWADTETRPAGVRNPEMGGY